jgi:hypothetical protein
MTLHARSVASTADVPDELFEPVVEALIESGEIKVWKARELAEQCGLDIGTMFMDAIDKRLST